MAAITHHPDTGRPAAHKPACLSPSGATLPESAKEAVVLSSHIFLWAGEALRTCSRPLVTTFTDGFHERSTLLPTVSALPRAGAEIAATTDSPRTRSERTCDDSWVYGREAEIYSLIQDPSPRAIRGQLRLAACQGMDPSVYHPDQGRPADLALLRCRDCPARLACLGLALRAEEPGARYGWYGGMGPDERSAIAASLGPAEPAPVPVPETAARAARLRADGWTIDSIAQELKCSRRTVQRYLRKAA